MRYFQVLLIALALVALSSVGLAQTASIAGTVTDSSGAVVQGAEVTVRNLATNENRSTKSSESGAIASPNRMAV